MEVPDDLTLPLLGICTRDSVSYDKGAHISTGMMARKWGQPGCSSADEQMPQM